MKRRKKLTEVCEETIPLERGSKFSFPAPPWAGSALLAVPLCLWLLCTLFLPTETAKLGETRKCPGDGGDLGEGGESGWGL